MKILDFYPTKGFFKEHKDIAFKVITDNDIKFIDGKIAIYDLDEEVYNYSFKDFRVSNDGDALINISKHDLCCGGYFAELILNDNVCFKTAFDIQKRWEDFPRYGYVSYFTPDHKNVEEQIESMAKYHVNGVQFYDWQYRHDNLLSDTTVYLDPFNREMSLETVNSFIDECHKRNMSAMPYLAVYAASVEFWEKHKEWGMYDKYGNPLMFEDFLGLVNPSYGSKWFYHLDSECDRVLRNTEFDGLHIDQYGEPKEAFDNEGNEIDIPNAFVDFINYQKDKHKGTVVFNAVGNWPIEQLTKSKADFMYIEVWEFTPTFADLRNICTNARLKSGQKPLVIPIYIKKDDFNNVLLADAIISSSGGTHLEIGDGERLLSDPYFPKAEDISSEQLVILRGYWDFVVGYQKVLGPKALWKDIDVTTDKNIMTIGRENGKLTAISFINCSEDDKWCEKMDTPTEYKDIIVDIEFNKPVKSVKFASADNKDISLESIDYKVNEDKIVIELSSLKYWSMIIIEEE